MNYQEQANNPFQKFNKLQRRVQRAIEHGSFFSYAKAKQQQLARRLKSYAIQLKCAIKPAIVTIFFSLGLQVAASGQVTFTLVPNSPGNPLNGVVCNRPAFVDIDGDGDMDCFVGRADATYDGKISYRKNDGTALAPSFTNTTGANNPFDGEDVGSAATPTFVDIDGDGDMDCFVGEFANAGSAMNYYENTGNSTAPAFTQRTGVLNPLDGLFPGYSSCPIFVDIDGDSDMDCFVSERDGSVKYYKNNGTASVPAFVAQSGANNPFNTVAWGASSYGHISFVDLDKDSDMDMFYTDYDGSTNGTIIHYYQNTGTTSVASFSEVTGSGNPFNSFNPFNTAVSFVDIDGDNDMDCFGVNGNAQLVLYRNDTPTGLFQLADDSAKPVVYPNPGNGIINFDKVVSGTIQVFNIFGQQVYNYNGENIQSLRLGHLESGNYFLTLYTKNEHFTYKIMLK